MNERCSTLDKEQLYNNKTVVAGEGEVYFCKMIGGGCECCACVHKCFDFDVADFDVADMCTLHSRRHRHTQQESRRPPQMQGQGLLPTAGLLLPIRRRGATMLCNKRKAQSMNIARTICLRLFSLQRQRHFWFHGARAS
jgi:hypothetical protein